ncbi:Carbohydrate sulfotransferase 14 [Sarcoptes scabiei]|uniref:Carbohydrate sulfotransferase n=1 Tax=Sarcoptes scabiei TaxID=52283 RepID=A0A834VD68_SARSC|nr:Carbohydrate sulfotransferase 14 [Sarcoptes scabiei]
MANDFNELLEPLNIDGDSNRSSHIETKRTEKIDLYMADSSQSYRSIILSKWIVFICLLLIIIIGYLGDDLLGNSNHFEINQKNSTDHGLVSWSSWIWSKDSLANPHNDRLHLNKYNLKHRSNRLPSLLIKPLDYVWQSPVLAKLNVSELERLFQKADHFKNDHREEKNLTEWLSDGINTENVYVKRRKRLDSVCRQYGFDNHIFTNWHLSSNRHFSLPLNRHYESRNKTKDRIDNSLEAHKFCDTRHCPLLVDSEHHLLTCFVQKIASTTIKHLYLLSWLKRMNKSSQVELPQHFHFENLTEFHRKVNDEIYRISPNLLKHSPRNYFRTTIFVRHPFVRIVSAFKDKAERDRDQERYFYRNYWNPILDHLHGHQRNRSLDNETITFKEFVEEILLKTDPYKYDEHWAPVWTRCEPCLVHYDFIGKLEESRRDFQTFRSMFNDNELERMDLWENSNLEYRSNQSQVNGLSDELKQNLNDSQRKRLSYSETVSYLRQLSPKTIIDLYKRYYLDFELFGYTIDELFDFV